MICPSGRFVAERKRIRYCNRSEMAGSSGVFRLRGHWRDGIQISRGDRSDNRQHAVALDQLARRILGRRNIGLVVLIDHFDRPNTLGDLSFLPG